MPAATNKADLLAVTTKDFAKLDKLISAVDTEAATLKALEDTSIKDTIGHRLHWIGLFLKWHDDGQAGREVHIPAKGYKWNQLKEYNAKVRADQADMSWDDVKKSLQENHEKLVALIESLSEDDLYGKIMIGNDKWTTGRYAEASGASHYRSAAKFIRQCLKAMG